MLVATSIAAVDRVSMSKKRPRPGDGVPDAVKREEGQTLHRLWSARKSQKLTQAAFAAQLGYSPGYFPQFFSGLRPLTLEIATAFAAELDVDIADFSPRLAKERDDVLRARGWPFKRVSQDEYQNLTKAQKDAVEAFVVAFLPEVAASSARKLSRVQ